MMLASFPSLLRVLIIREGKKRFPTLSTDAAAAITTKRRILQLWTHAAGANDILGQQTIVSLHQCRPLLSNYYFSTSSSALDNDNAAAAAAAADELTAAVETPPSEAVEKTTTRREQHKRTTTADADSSSVQNNHHLMNDDGFETSFGKHWTKNFQLFKEHIEKLQQKQKQKEDDSATSKKNDDGNNASRRLNPGLPYPTDPHLANWLEVNRRNYRAWLEEEEEEGEGGKEPPNSISKTKQEEAADLGQRSLYASTMAQRMMLLSSLGVSLNPRQDYWDIMYQALIEFVERHEGSFPYDVPFASLNEEDRRLYYWSQRQKKDYKLFVKEEEEEQLTKEKTRDKNKEDSAEKRAKAKSPMTAKRRDLLEAAGFAWDAWDETWLRRYNELVEYYNHHGDCLVPSDYKPNRHLGFWVGEQRTNYAYLMRPQYAAERGGSKTTKRVRRAGSLTPQRLQMLERLGFAWSAPEAKWQIRYSELEEHVKINGPGSLPKSNKSLRRWLNHQRSVLRNREKQKTNAQDRAPAAKANSLSDETLAKRKELLERLGFY